MRRGCMIGPDCTQPGWLGGDDVPFCPTCLVTSAQDIADLPLDYLDLAQLMGKGGGGTDEGVSRPKPASKPPVNLAVDAMMRRIVWHVATWEALLRDNLNLPEVPAESVRPGFLTARAAVFLTRRMSALIALPSQWVSYGAEPKMRDGIDAVLDLRSLHAVARSALGVTEHVIHLPGDCPGCGGLALRRRDGGDQVWCDLCKREWEYPDYQRYVSLMTVVCGDYKTLRGSQP